MIYFVLLPLAGLTSVLFICQKADTHSAFKISLRKNTDITDTTKCFSADELDTAAATKHTLTVAGR